MQRVEPCQLHVAANLNVPVHPEPFEDAMSSGGCKERKGRIAVPRLRDEPIMTPPLLRSLRRRLRSITLVVGGV